MATLTTTPAITITLTSEQSAQVREFVREGRFSSPEDALAQSVEMLMAQASLDDLTPETEARLGRSISQIQHGERIPGEQAMAKLDNLIHELEAR